jgi:hypothetical protein
MFFASTQVAAGRSKEADELSAITVKFTIAAANLEGNTKGTFVGTQIAKMNDMYSERAQTAKARTGNWSDDNIIRSDGEACRQVVQ